MALRDGHRHRVESVRLGRGQRCVCDCLLMLLVFEFGKFCGELLDLL